MQHSKTLTKYDQQDETDTMIIKGSFFNNIASVLIAKWILKKYSARGVISVKDLRINLDKSGCSFSMQIDGNFNEKNSSLLKANIFKSFLIGE